MGERAGPGAIEGLRAQARPQNYLNGLTADVQRGECIDPRKSTETFGSVAEQWFLAKQRARRKPKTLAGYRSPLDALVLPCWGDVSLKSINYEQYSTWLGSLSVDGVPYGTGLSAGRILQAHQLVGAVLKYAQRAGKIAKNVASEIKRDEDLPHRAERERRYLSHVDLFGLAQATGRFEVLTLVLGYCGLRFGEAVALRARHVRDRELTVRASASAVAGEGSWSLIRRRRERGMYLFRGPVWERLRGGAT